MPTDAESPNGDFQFRTPAYNEMRACCGFGLQGLCCAACGQGPCRLSPFGADPNQGLCHRSRDGIVAHQLGSILLEGLALLWESIPAGRLAATDAEATLHLLAALARPGDSEWDHMLWEARHLAGRFVQMAADDAPLFEVPPVADMAGALRGHTRRGIALLAGTPSPELVELGVNLRMAGAICLACGPETDWRSRPFMPCATYIGAYAMAGSVAAYAREVQRAAGSNHLPLVVATSGDPSPLLAALALGLAELGAAVHTGCSLPVAGSSPVVQWLAAGEPNRGVGPIITVSEPVPYRQVAYALLAALERP